MNAERRTEELEAWSEVRTLLAGLGPSALLRAAGMAAEAALPVWMGAAPEAGRKAPARAVGAVLSRDLEDDAKGLHALAVAAYGAVGASRLPPGEARRAGLAAAHAAFAVAFWQAGKPREKVRAAARDAVSNAAAAVGPGFPDWFRTEARRLATGREAPTGDAWPNARDRERITTAIRQLASDTPTPERNLVKLAEAWGRPVPCRAGIGTPLPPVLPTAEAIASVARWVSSPNPHVARAALAALEKAGPAARLVLPKVAAALHSGEPLVRLAAARVFASAAPCPEHVAALRDRLGDRLFSVRWAAVEAIAKSDDGTGLAEVLEESRPRLDARGAGAMLTQWLRAVRALGPGAARLLPRLLETRARVAALRSTEGSAQSLWDEGELDTLVRRLHG